MKIKVVIISGAVLLTIVLCSVLFMWQPAETISCPEAKAEKTVDEENDYVLDWREHEAENIAMYEKLYNHMKKYQPACLTDGNGEICENLNIVGSIKNLAEEECVYSARFMGNTGYFVTFQQIDPLFSVDFSDPAQPKVLGELKISWWELDMK